MRTASLQIRSQKGFIVPPRPTPTKRMRTAAMLALTVVGVTKRTARGTHWRTTASLAWGQSALVTKKVQVQTTKNDQVVNFVDNMNIVSLPIPANLHLAPCYHDGPVRFMDNVTYDFSLSNNELFQFVLFSQVQKRERSTCVGTTSAIFTVTYNKLSLQPSVFNQSFSNSFFILFKCLSLCSLL